MRCTCIEALALSTRPSSQAPLLPADSTAAADTAAWQRYAAELAASRNDTDAFNTSGSCSSALPQPATPGPGAVLLSDWLPQTAALLHPAVAGKRGARMPAVWT
jgi:hypothetical protein